VSIDVHVGRFLPEQIVGKITPMEHHKGGFRSIDEYIATSLKTYKRSLKQYEPPSKPLRLMQRSE
jgi:hypothetical protein